MVVAASMSVLLASRTGKRGEWLPWTLLIVGSLANLAANVAVANPTAVSRLIAAWPSLAFVGAYHVLQGQLRTGRADPAARPEDLNGNPQCHLLEIAHDGTSILESPGRRLQRQAWEWALANRSQDGPVAPRGGHGETLQPQPSMGTPGKESRRCRLPRAVP
jgi:hypothetical protein